MSRCLVQFSKGTAGTYQGGASLLVDAGIGLKPEKALDSLDVRLEELLGL